MYKTGEIYEVMTQFENTVKRMPVYSGGLEREPKADSGRWEHDAYYCDGQTNALFLAYLWGHSHGRCYERQTRDY